MTFFSRGYAPVLQIWLQGCRATAFTECSTLRHFLLSVCGEYPAPCALLYIRGMLRTCLSRHDDGGQWFADLRAMEQQVSRATVDGYPGGGPGPHLLSGLKIHAPRQQVSQPVHRPVLDMSQDITQPYLRIHAVKPAGPDQRVQNSCTLSARG